MNQAKVGIVRLVLVLLIATAFGCQGPNQEQKTKTTESAKTKITICQWGQALIYLPLYIAMQKGYFADEGLDVTVTNGGGDDLSWAAVTSGNAQFGIADPTMVAIQAEQGGVPGKVVGNIVGRVAFWAVTLDPNVLAITKPEDFKGTTIACFKYPNTANALALKTIEKAGLKKGIDVKLVEVNYEAVLAQLQNKEANIAMVLEPAASLAVSQGARIIYSYPKDWGNFAFTGLTTTDKYIKEHPEVVQKVVNALEKAMRFAYTNHSGTVEVGLKAFPDLPKNVIESAVQRMIDDKTIPEHIAVDDDGWQKALGLCVDVAKLKQTYPTEQFVDNSFAKKAMETK